MNAAAPSDPIQPPRLIETADGLKLTTTTTAQSEVFERFYAGYDKAFVLPNEKEGREGFALCFDLNHGEDYKRLSALYGPYCEISFVAEHDGSEIGGANFIAMPADDKSCVTANLNYIYVNEAARGRGYFSRMVAAVRDAAGRLFPAAQARVLIFIEQNDPFRMSAEDYRHDTEFTGLDQFDRLRMWAKLGAYVVDFPYAQPPLSAAQEVDDTLVYSVLGADADALPACILGGHLRRFFGVSVLKGMGFDANPAALGQIEALRRACAADERVRLLDPAPLLEKVHGRDDIARLWRDPPPTFRAALRA
jgi:GNAT superfamily N-acetyltransferase